MPKKALKGTRSTSAAPLVEELTSTAIDRRRAFLDGHYGALLEELNASLRAAFRVANRRKPEDMPVLPDGRLDANIQPFISIARVEREEP